jgi:hypothetical protein
MQRYRDGAIARIGIFPWHTVFLTGQLKPPFFFDGVLYCNPVSPCLPVAMVTGALVQLIDSKKRQFRSNTGAAFGGVAISWFAASHRWPGAC